jgi:hypothetical protein
MGYMIANGAVNLPGRTLPVIVRASKDPVQREIEGWKAYARANDGTYRRVYLSFQESGWVDGTNEGAWGTANFDSAEQAKAMAGKAYRWMNR